MGIRIKRHLGYALTDFEGEQDSRVNTEIFKDRWELCDDYVKFAIENIDEAVKILEAELDEDSYRIQFWADDIRHLEDVPYYKRPDAVTYQPEFGMENVLLFQPVHKEGWYRRDDIMDHYAHHAQHQISYEPELVDLREELGLTSIHTYPKQMHRHPDAETPEEKVDSFIAEQKAHGSRLSFMYNEGFGLMEGVLEGRDYNRMVGLFGEDRKPDVRDEELLTHLKEDWYTHVPADIRLFARWSGIFTDFNTVYTLKPVLYTYWS